MTSIPAPAVGRHLKGFAGAWGFAGNTHNAKCAYRRSRYRLSGRSSELMTPAASGGVVDCGQESGHGHIDANDPRADLKSRPTALKNFATTLSADRCGA